MAELRFLEPEDERFRNTVSTIEKRLLRGDFLLAIRKRGLGRLARNRTAGLYVLVDSGTRLHRRNGPGPCRIRKNSFPPQPSRPAFGRCLARGKRTVGKFPTNLQHGRTDPVRTQTVQTVGKRFLNENHNAGHERQPNKGKDNNVEPRKIPGTDLNLSVIAFGSYASGKGWAPSEREIRHRSHSRQLPAGCDDIRYSTDLRAGRHGSDTRGSPLVFPAGQGSGF